MMETNLPKGWVEIKLGDILKLKNGYAFNSNDYSEEGVPVIRISDIKEGKVTTKNSVRVAEKLLKEEFLVQDGDILVAMSGATTGKYGLYRSKERALQNQRVGNLKPHSEKCLSKSFIYYLLGSLKEKIEDKAYGGAQPNISPAVIEEIETTLPPLPEQKRIVAKLDAAFAHLDILKAKLDRIPVLLKNFRQAVLTQAVTGKLTEEWNKGQYQVVALNEVAEKIQIGPFGTQLHKHDYVSNGIPLINPSHIRNGNIEADYELTVLNEKYDQLGNYHLKIGDVIMGRRGEMGRCALITENENGWLCGTGSLFIRPNKLVDGRYLYWALSSNGIKKYLEAQANGSTMSNLNWSIVKSIVIPLPSLVEQKKIFEKVDVFFAKAAAIEAQYISLKEKIDALPRALLARAFRGELVAQDENDEPASVLLERIRQLKHKTAGGSSEAKSRKYQKLKVRGTRVK